jgi:hypothetical protein
MSTETSRRRKIEMKDTSKRRVYMHVTAELDRKRIQGRACNGTDESGFPCSCMDVHQGFRNGGNLNKYGKIKIKRLDLR